MTAGTALSDQEPTAARNRFAWWLLSAAVPLICCAARLELDFWHDEIYTIVYFASRPLGEIVTDYSAPNNHILYTLLLAPLTWVSLIEPWLRLPSLIAALVTLALVYRLGTRIAGVAAGLFATTLLGLSPMFLVHVMQVRGYGLSMALTTGLAMLAVGGKVASARRAIGIVLIAAAAIYTIPTNALFVVSLGVAASGWDLARDGWRCAAIGVAVWGVGLGLGLACYAPVLSQLIEHSRASAAASPEAVGRLAGRVFAAAGHDSWPLALVALGLLPAWWLQRKERAAWLALAIAVLLPWLGCTLGRTTPFERNFTPLLPLLAVLVAAPWGLVAEYSRRRWPRVAASSISSATAILIPLVMLVPAVWWYPQRLAARCQRGFVQDGYYNYYAADYRPRAIASALAPLVEEPGDYVVYFAAEDQANLVYYLNQAGVAVRRQTGSPLRGRVFAIVPPRPDFAQFNSRFGMSEADLRKLWTVADSGYYRLLSSVPPSR